MEVFLKTEDEIESIRQASQLVGRTLAELAKNIGEGVTTKQLDNIAEEFICDNGGVPIFKGFPNPYGKPFPACICTSVNSVVVHGIPDDKTTLKSGDIISVDCGILLNGFCGDSAYTFCVGDVDKETRKLLKTTKESLYEGINAAQAGKHLGDIGYAVQSYCESKGYGVVRELTGHGIGKNMHEKPQVPNYGKFGDGMLLKSGMCLAIEPMITMGGASIGLLPDRWSIRTRDNRAAAHFEHTIAIRNGKAEILSTFEEIEQIEGKQY